MKILKRLAAALIVLLIVLAGIGLLLPRQVSISRSIVISAPPDKIFAILNGFQSFDRWSPWAEKDPQLKVQFSGPASGVGAKYEWSGNKAVGAGSQEIIESIPVGRIQLRLFFSGFDQPNIATYFLTVTGEGTLVRWQLDTDLGGNPVSRYFGLMMDRMVGPDFANGLARLKQLTQSTPAD